MIIIHSLLLYQKQEVNYLSQSFNSKGKIMKQLTLFFILLTILLSLNKAPLIKAGLYLPAGTCLK
jgi:hypothetical protein